MSGTLLVLREGPHWQAGQLDGGSHRSWWLEVLVQHQLCHNRTGSQLPTLCSCNIVTFPPAGLPMVALLHLSTAFRKGIQVQHYVWVMQVASMVLQLHLCPTVATALHPTWQPCSLVPRHHHVPIFCLSYTGLNWDSSICNKWNNMFKALSIDHHKCRISLDFKGLLFLLRSEACPGHHHPGPALSLKGMP